MLKHFKVHDIQSHLQKTKEDVIICVYIQHKKPEKYQGRY